MSWDQVRDRLDLLNFPTEFQGFAKLEGIGEEHGAKRFSHPLVTYQLKTHLEDEGTKYLLIAKYNFCPNCQEVRNKAFTLINHPRGVVYRKWFLWHGGASYE